jgi:hypothetical protein
MESPDDLRVRVEGGDERSLGELLRELNDQSRDLIRQEMELAKTELQENLQRAKRGGMWLGAATVPALVGIVCLALGLTHGLGQAMADWGSAFVWAFVMFGAAAGLAFAGKKQLDRVEVPPAPRTAETLRETGQSLGGG